MRVEESFKTRRMDTGRLIIGLVGTLGAGKSTVTKYLETLGFKPFRLSDVIREKFKNRTLKRNSLQDSGNKLRKKYGTSYLAKKTLEKIEKKGLKKAVVDGIRNLGEFEYFASKSNFYLVSVNAPAKIRYLRLKDRKGVTDPRNWQEFLAIEKRDLDEKLYFGQQTKKVMQKADFSVVNINLTKLNRKIDQILDTLQKK